MKVWKKLKNKQKKNNGKVNTLSLEKRIEHGVQALDRANTLCGNCDNKASFALALIGVLINALMTETGTGIVRTCITNYKETGKGCLSLYSCVGIIAILFILFGIFLFCRVLFANTKHGSQTDIIESVVFFGEVASYASAKDYWDRVQSIPDEEYWADLETQVYWVSKIAVKKFKCFNCGMIAFLLGTIMSALVILLGYNGCL